MSVMEAGVASKAEVYAGRYVTEAGVAVTVGGVGAGLWAQIRGLPPVLFLNEGAGAFYEPESGLALQFAPPRLGVSPGFVLTQPGCAATTRARRAA